MRRYALILGTLLPLLAAGCVEKKFLVTSDPPGAQVTVNNQRLGFTTVDGSFVYYGYYDLTLVKPGYETLHVRQAFNAPWYEYPPFDFFAEVLVPWEIKDVKRLGPYHLEPVQAPHTDEVERRAGALKSYADALGAPAAPRPLPATPPAPPVGLAPPVAMPPAGP